MFEDIRKEDEKVAGRGSGKVEDMFNDVDPAPEPTSAVRSGHLKPTQQGAVGAAPPSPPGAVQVPPPGQHVGPPRPLTHLSQIDEWSSKKPRKGMRLAIISMVAIIAIGATAYFVFFYQAAVPAPDTTGTITPDDSINATNDTSVPADNQNSNIDIPTNARIDSDGDGLTDVEEQVFGTDPESIDTDNDGLSDSDEVNIYKTDPLQNDTDNDALSDRDEIFVWQTDPNNPDSDNDTYQDGAEIQNGYDPKGPGRLNPSDIE